MKKVILACAGVCMLISCEQRSVYEGTNLVIEDKFMMQQAYSVPLQSGMISVVTLGEDTLAITDVAININIPLDATPVTKADEEGKVQVSYVAYKDMPLFTAGTYIKTDNHTLFFEDSQAADYDYNDLVLHVRTMENGKIGEAQVFKIFVRGLALGSGKKIAFGVTDRNGVDFELSDNVRRDYFGNKTGFLNTKKEQAFVVGIEAGDMDDENRGDYIIHHRPTNGKPMKTGFVEYPLIAATYISKGNERKDLSFYIRVDGNVKLYVGEYDKNMEGALPYGIRTPETQNNYPLEQVPIQKAFPQFMNWVMTGSPTDWNSKANADLSNCYQLDSSELWRW